jgi:YVTN family beta-propeller protein
MDGTLSRKNLGRFTAVAARAGGFLVAACILFPQAGLAQQAAPLQLEAKIPLGAVAGRIDHMAIDRERARLFVAELGNDSVGVVDLRERKVMRTIAGLKEPQGVGYVGTTDTVYVANARDGSVRLYQGADYAPAGRIDLGNDADNIRVDANAGRVVVGYSNGLAIIDPAARVQIANVALKAHPEGFQLDRTGNRVFVNVPDAREIAVVDQKAGRQTASWSSLIGGAHFPMALDEARGQVLVVFRSPPKLAVYAMDDGKLAQSVETCGDSDDLFVDEKRHRVYVSCGAGYIDVFDLRDGTYRRAARLLTSSGARTSLFVPELDQLLLAVRAASGGPAAVWVFRPGP